MQKIVGILFCISLFSIVLGQIGRLPIKGLEGGVYLSDLFVFLLFVCWFIWRIAKRHFSLNLVDLAILFLIFVTAVSLLFAVTWAKPAMLIVAFMYWVRLCMYLALFRIGRDIISSKTKIILLTAGVLFAIFGFIQYAVVPDFSNYAQYGWDPHYYRVLSTFFDPNYAGLFLAIFAIFALYFLYQKPLTLTWRSLIYGTLFCTFGAMTLLTFSRSTYLALGIGLLVFSLLKDRRILFLMFILGALAFIFIPRVQTRIIGAINFDATARLRFVNYAETIKIIKAYPFWGTGFNTLRYAKQEQGVLRDERGVILEGGFAGAGSDNSLLFIMATSGFLGLLAEIFLFLSVLKTTWHKSGFTMTASLLATVFVHSQFVNSLFYAPILAFFLVIIAYAQNDE